MSEERKIDWRQVRALVRAFILMSVRTMPIRTMRGEKRGSGVGSILFVVFLFAFFGAVLSMMVAAIKDVFAFSFMLHLMSLFLVGSSAMSEASEVLFSSSENDVLLHRPIPPSTLVLSKAITIVAFTLMLALALNLFPTIAMLWIDNAGPIAPLAHLVSVVLSTVFASAVVVSLYGLVARLLGRTRLQRVVTAAQVGSTLFLAVGFQLVPRLMDPQHGIDISAFVHASWWSWFLPPAWFAAIDAWLGSTVVDPRMMALALTGIGVTVIFTWLGVLRLPSTSSNAASIQEETRKEVAPPKSVRGRSRFDRLVALLIPDPVERASFGLAKAYLLRDRNVKVRLASALGVFLILPLLAVFDSHRVTAMPVLFFWMSALVPVTVIESLRITSNPAASDLFLYSPIERGASVFHGVRKAAILLVQVPIALYTGLVAAWASRSNPEQLLLVIPALFVFPVVSLMPALIDSYVPLSIAARTGQRSVQTLMFFIVMIPAGLVAWLAYQAQKSGILWQMVIVEAVVMLVLHQLLMRHIARRAMTDGAQGPTFSAGRKVGSALARLRGSQD